MVEVYVSEYASLSLIRIVDGLGAVNGPTPGLAPVRRPRWYCIVETGLLA